MSSYSIPYPNVPDAAISGLELASMKSGTERDVQLASLGEQLQRLENEDRNSVSAGINRQFESFSLGLDLEASDDGSFLTRLSLSTGFGVEPRGGG